MEGIDEVLKDTGDDKFDRVLAAFREKLAEARGESSNFVRENGQMLEEWMVLRSNGELSDAEFESLIQSQKRLTKQFLNSQKIAARARLESLSMGLLDTVLDRFVGRLF